MSSSGNIIEEIRKAFVAHFSEEPEVIMRSPGRINLIGEHTDYNGGFVLPAAINKSIYFAFGKRDNNEILLHAHDLHDSYSCRTGEFSKSDKKWPDYIVGVLSQLKKKNISVPAFNCVFGGDIPVGAGLSSSAALECGTIYGLSRLFSIPLSPIDIALTGQAAENEFVGVQCGIMDQFACVFGKAVHVIKLDCRNMTHEYVPFHSNDYTIVLCDTGIKHALAETEYNTRRKECEAGAAIVKASYPDISSLRDATLEQLNTVKGKMDETAYKRCKYVIEEIERVTLACEDLKRNDFIAFGNKMYDTHNGLQHEYNVSCMELDFLVNESRKHSYVAGARMMGGGFGGCTINLVQKEKTGDFISSMSHAYMKAFNNELKSYLVEITDGVREIK